MQMDGAKVVGQSSVTEIREDRTGVGKERGRERGKNGGSVDKESSLDHCGDRENNEGAKTREVNWNQGAKGRAGAECKGKKGVSSKAKE